MAAKKRLDGATAENEWEEATGIFVRRDRSFDLADSKQRTRFIQQQTQNMRELPRNALADIAHLEAELVRLLEARGYRINLDDPGSWLAASEKVAPWTARDAIAALQQFTMLRGEIERGISIDSAVRHALRAMQAWMKAMVGEPEPFVKQGRATMRGQKSGGAKTAMVQRTKADATERKVLDEAGRLKPKEYGFGNKVARKAGVSPATVSRILKKNVSSSKRVKNS